MTVLGSQCSTCPPTAQIATNVIGGALPAGVPATNTSPPTGAFDPAAFPALIKETYDECIVIYISSTGASWNNCVLPTKASSTTYTGVVDSAAATYDTENDLNQNATPGGTAYPASPNNNDTYWEQFGNGFLIAKYDDANAEWDHLFISSCCPDNTISIPSADFTALAPGTVVNLESPTASDVNAYIAANALTLGPGTQITYTSPNGSYFTWIVDPAGNAIPHEERLNIRECLNEGVVTAAPTTVTAPSNGHIWVVDTSAGDVDLSGIDNTAGFVDGAVLTFKNTGEQNLLFTETQNGNPVTYTAQGQGSILSLCFDETSNTFVLLD